jgi:arginyl-tRNA synthetase
VNIIEKLEKILKEVISNLGYKDDVKLNVSNRPELGDYQYNGAFNLAKTYHKAPKIIADEIVLELQKKVEFKEVSNANGFVNLSISDDELTKYINDIIDNFNINTYHIDTNETIFLDYGGANVAKPLHAGHMRSPNIGEAMKRLCEAVGYKTISDVHLGDWGRPMGLVICEIHKRMPDLPYFKEDYDGSYNKCPVSLEELNELYPFASNKAKEDSEYLEEARDFTNRLQKKEKGIYALWQSFWNLSISDIKEIYGMLNTSFDLWEGEASAEEYVKPVLDYLIGGGYTSISEGATVINVKEDNDEREVPPVMLIKSNGGILYDTTELATLYYREKRFQPDKYLYFTDIRQELHFIEAFRAAHKTKLVPETTSLEWYGFGTMNGPDGKPFKTRDGGVMSLRELIGVVQKECRKVIKDNIKEEDKDKLALNLAIAAIKYADLLPNRASDYIFDPVKFSDVNGKTGPYLLYSTVRMNSLINKCDIEPNKYHKINTLEERNIILNIINLESTMEKSFKARSLNEICEYLYKLTNSFNTFYSNHEVNKENDKDVKESYITLTKLVYDINKYLLNILAINVPDKI